MKKRILHAIMIMAVGVLAITSCGNKAKHEGVYTGIMPCADCSGIYTEITLTGDEYTMKQVYQGTENDEEATFINKGVYTWDKSSNVITFNNDLTERYLVKNNSLIALDMDGNQITGDLADMYILKKK